MINVKARKAEYRFAKADGSGGVKVVMYYHKSGRGGGAYSATAYEYEIQPGVEIYAPFDASRLFTEFVPRYSARSFTAFAEKVMADFPGNVPAGSKVAAALTEIEV